MDIDSELFLSCTASCVHQRTKEPLDNYAGQCDPATVMSFTSTSLYLVKNARSSLELVGGIQTVEAAGDLWFAEVSCSAKFDKNENNDWCVHCAIEESRSAGISKSKIDVHRSPAAASLLTTELP